MNIAQIRAQYPQYQDLSDKQLADALHSKFYSDIPIQDYYGRIGLAPTTGAFAAGVKSYLPQVQETFGGLKTLLGVGAERVLGEGQISRGLIESGAASMKEAEAKRQPFMTAERGSFTDALNKGVGTVLTEWLPYQAGSGAAQLVEALALVGAGGLAGTMTAPGPGTLAGAGTGLVARELAKRGVKEAAEKILKERGEDAAKAYFEKAAKDVALDIGKKRGQTAALAGQAAFYGTGQTTSRAVEEAEKLGGTATDIELARVLPAAAVSTVAEFIGDKIALGALKGLKPGEPGKFVATDLAKNILLNIGLTGTKEVPVEVIQSAAERFGAKLSLTDAQALKEYIDATASSYGMAVAPGVGGGVRQTMTERELAKDKREQAEIETLQKEVNDKLEQLQFNPPTVAPEGAAPPVTEESVAPPAPPAGPTPEELARIQDEHETAIIEGLIAQDVEMARAKQLAEQRAQEQSEAEFLESGIKETDRRVREGRIFARVQDLIDRNIPFASTAINDINQKFGVINEAPLTEEERARVENIMGMVSTFTNFVNLPVLAPKPMDPFAENQQMEALIRERTERGQAQPIRTAPAAPSPSVQETPVSQGVGEGPAIRPPSGVEPSVAEDSELVTPAPVVEAAAPVESKKASDIFTPPTLDYRLKKRGGSTYIVPPVGKSFTKETRTALREWAKNAGFFASSTGDNEIAVAAMTGGPTLDYIVDGVEEQRIGRAAEKERGNAKVAPIPTAPTVEAAAPTPSAQERKSLGGKRSELGLYSELEKKIEAGSNKAPAASWKAYINGLTQKGVKPEEIESSGVKDWLDLQQGAVTKESLLNYLKQGGVKVEEVVLGRSRVKETKYGQYTLPGGTNYREVLLTLPNSRVDEALGIRQWRDKMREKYGTVDWRRYATSEEIEKSNEIANRSRSVNREIYRSSHWDQPNVLAHIRVNDRTDADGNKVLFVEEIQSDWGQQGKKEGFGRESMSDDRLRQLIMEADSNADVEGLPRNTLLEIAANVGVKGGPIPTAPFVTKTEGWLNLALKRIMVMAAEGGYDKVAFVNGEQSADRYDLSKTIKYVQWNTGYDKNRRLVTLETADGKELGMTVQDGIVEDSSIGADGKPLDEVLGKELADKIVSQDSGDLRGLQLKMGGEGMKTFYDTIVPTALKKLLPKVGGGQMGVVKVDGIVRASTGNMEAGDFYDRQENTDFKMLAQPGFDVTPAMREKVQTTGLPMFSKAGERSEQVQAFEQDLRTKLNKFGLKDAGLKILGGMTDSGSYAAQIIKIAADAANPVRTLRHEAIHALRELGFFTDAQWKSLSKMAKDKWIDQYLKQRNVDGKPLKAGEESRYDAYMREYNGDMEKITEEAVSDAFADFDATKPPAGLIQALLKRMKDLFQSIKSALTKVESPEQIFGKVEKGELKEGAREEAGEAKSLRDRATADIRKSIGGRNPGEQAISRVKAAAQKALQKQPMPEKGLGHVKQDLKNLAQPIFFAQNKTILDRIDGMKDRFWQRVAQNTADQFRTIKEYSPLGYMQARLSKSVDGGLEGLLFHGQVFDDGGALNIKAKTKGMMDILKPLGNELDSYLMWVALNRESNLPEEKRSKIANMDQLVARRDEFSAGELNGKPRVEVYRDVLRQMNQLNKSVLDIALAKGLINQEAYDKFSSDIYYIPFYKKMEEDGDISGAQTASGLTSQYFSKELKGGDKPFGDLMENVVRNWSHILSASMKNAAAKTTLDDAVELGAAVPNLKVGLEWKDGKVYSIKSGKPIEAKVEEDGKEYAEGELRPDLTKQDAGMAKVMVDGQPMYFKVTDDLLMDSISSIGYLGPKSKFILLMRDFKNMLQYGVTASPIFKVNNLIRDSVAAMAVSDLKKNPVANVLKGISLSDKDSPTYISALAGGAIFNFGSAYEGDQAKLIKRLLDQGVPGDSILDTKEKITKGLKTAWDAYQNLGDKSEAANRLSLYQQMRDKGMTHLQASFMARDLLDFSMQGSWPAFRFFTQVVPFMNARIQGLYKLGRDGIIPTTRVLYNATTGKEIDANDKIRAAQFATITTAVMLASALLYLSFKDDEDFKKRDAWDRDNFWWIKLPGMDVALRVPKPFEVGAFGTLVERSLEQILDEGAEGKQFGESLARTLWDTFALNPTPQMFKPLVDIYSNKDSFSGAPIESAGLERLSKQERATDQTSPLAIALGGLTSIFPEKFQLSPVQMDYMLKGYFGWLGAMASVTSTYAVMPFKEGEYPDARWLDRASLGLARELPAPQSAYVTQFYNASKEISQAYADMRHYREMGDAERVQEILEEKGDKIALAKFYDKTAKNIANVRKQIRLITNDKDMDGAEKKEAIERMKLIMSDLAKQAEEVRKSMKQ